MKQAPFHVLAGARMAAVLLELGFVSHPVEGKDLARAQRQEAIAGAVAAGIAAWRSAGGATGSATGAMGGAANDAPIPPAPTAAAR